MQSNHGSLQKYNQQATVECEDVWWSGGCEPLTLCMQSTGVLSKNFLLRKPASPNHKMST